MRGYQPDFLGDDFRLELPDFAPRLGGNVVRKVGLREQIYADYPNYTVVTHTEERSPIVVAFNYDKAKLKSTRRTDRWDIDSRIGPEFQLNNDYYKGRDNPWDRGHLARRVTAGWGETPREAQRAADETFYYSNACLQHANFNQDEWLALEDWVLNLDLAMNGKISVFMGPVYGAFLRTIRPAGRPSASIPSGFFKIVVFVNKRTSKLDVRTFLMFQDEEALSDRSGRRGINFQNYQVTVTEIERLTGLEFADAMYDGNPLLFHENPRGREVLNISHFPERVEVNTPEELVDANTTRDFFADEEIHVYITAAMVNPSGPDRGHEWVSIANYSDATVDLEGWTLSDTKREPLDLGTVLSNDDRILQPGEAVRVRPVSPLQLGNNGGVIVLYAKPEDGQDPKKKKRVARVRYSKDDAKNVGTPVIFGSA